MSQPAVIKVASMLCVPCSTKLSGNGLAASNSSCAPPANDSWHRSHRDCVGWHPTDDANKNKVCEGIRPVIMKHPRESQV